MPEFKPFPKIPRLMRDMVVTEKLNGTNASVYIEEATGEGDLTVSTIVETPRGFFRVQAGSRNRWISPTNDNFGFAKWVWENAGELMNLGIGHHFGEWFGKGIQCGYNLDTRRFALFNTSKWMAAYKAMKEGHQTGFPECCEVVPELFRGPFSTTVVNEAMNRLKLNGSYAVPKFMAPEGVVVFHSASNQIYKRTFEHDAMGKEAA